MNKRLSSYISLAGLLLTAFALLASIFLGFGGFSVQALSGHEITGYVSRPQLVFLVLAAVGLILSGVAYRQQATRQKVGHPHFILLPYFAASMLFFAAAILGLTSQLRGPEFWGETTFEEIQNTLLFNNLTLASFLILGTLQMVLLVLFLKTKLLQQHQLSTMAKILTLTAGILLIVKTIIDYPLIKEAIFISSYMLKVPSLNNIISLTAPPVYLLAQIPITIILLHNQKTSARP